MLFTEVVLLKLREKRSDSGFGFGRLDFSLTRDSLSKLRLKARRRGCWFRCLKPTERRLLDLTIRVCQSIRSFTLLKLVSRLVDRLFKAMESLVHRLIRTEGLAMAKRLSEIGEALGCISARRWAEDWSFVQFLTINNLQQLKAD